MKKLVSLLLVLVLAVGLAACGSSSSGGETAAGEKITLKISTPDPDNASVSVAAKELAKVIGEKSNGEIEVTVHPNGTLYGGDPSAAVKQLGAGGLDMLVLSTSLYANFDSRFSAISIPYLFDDKEQFLSFLNGDLGTELLDSVSELDIKGLGYWTRDFRQITNSKRPITKPEDLKGIKLRVPNNPLWVEFFKGAGTVTTPMDFSEVYNALQLKTIDGQENPLGVITASKMYEVQKYLTISNHMADGWLVGMNQAKFDKLTDEQKKIISDSVKEIQGWSLDYDNKEAETAIKLMEDEGVEVNELTSEQQQQFIELSKQAYPTFKELVKDDQFFSDILEFVGKSE
ncbi:DctP family TRAP transporter solute-binding subunit [Bacillus sp. ISL-35]|uniref:DctP family TRAP transporter solute-binding subunit n=1 Tax=Bacillus sp. ISL-35 TaxID=2819122 RepID=UPI001BE7A2CD|nr:DctP family TRAP transporter solute-binding subunit [Bacillus sp. ISL-35]MBT2678699.1 DctP family TRAP transporter solute-binding subunit [Bacillus sp. ISL-35]MBT2703691.1 DctP family TRAP transporter solute-binding subunit [Chryseobacterium sp. ISL-80]